jgi:hypothetical protein
MTSTMVIQTAASTPAEAARDFLDEAERLMKFHPSESIDAVRALAEATAVIDSLPALERGMLNVRKRRLLRRLLGVS